MYARRAATLWNVGEIRGSVRVEGGARKHVYVRYTGRGYFKVKSGIVTLS